ncbi:hypothetical protein HJC23_010536 [Cyclotella cryptica]|uniref:Uncharacterized protein n=1 Tax=Cyclotella cryptica TaxID=29204 RepID=A0ABD3QB94_9STRA|eukprot:CCRYP_007117-RB/>CCRYP_007117-RB protein AED:0.00 eAED:0.00 QI:144/-1/1/1/-1/1/1/169/243
MNSLLQEMKEEVNSDEQSGPLVPAINEAPDTSLVTTLPESDAPSDENRIEQPPLPTQEQQHDEEHQQQQHEDEAEEQAISEVIDEAIAASASPCNDATSSSPPQPTSIAATPSTTVAPQPTQGIVPTGQEQTGRWTRDEQERFIHALETYGKEWKKVAAAVQTRTVVQVRTHAQKFQKRLARMFDKCGGEGEEAAEAQILSAVEMETESVGGRMRLRVDEGELRRWKKLHVLFSTTHGGYGKN